MPIKSIYNFKKIKFPKKFELASLIEILLASLKMSTNIC